MALLDELDSELKKFALGGVFCLSSKDKLFWFAEVKSPKVCKKLSTQKNIRTSFFACMLGEQSPFSIIFFLCSHPKLIKEFFAKKILRKISKY
ncbi:hypothetical protein BpHYR1_018870 [Brachionus plicatilis]|uniref:Uncharacterized protein n=1 Tax=Brachionus plicatilis TaxID=10195 RepID=A0A3M7RPL5_BRAPC|nr:hypothetical protein BpHYR1_018870 [Brachionus plicatilis]